jgi:curved DNA-binding protein CbpA
MRLQRPGEIDYYEELGVDRNAPADEIRDSFRALVRLLHPDHQQDEHLKTIAERQLRRVNRIYAVLSDPERRRRYDELLEEDFRPPTIIYSPVTGISAKQLISRFVWAGAAILGVALVIWIATDQPSVPVYSGEHSVVSARQPASSVATSAPPDSEPVAAPESPQGIQDEVSILRTQLRAMRQQRDQARQEVARLSGGKQPADEVGGVELATAPAVQAAPVNSGPAAAELAPPHIAPQTPKPALASMGPAFRTVKPPGSDPHQFAGFWYFARGNGQRPRNLYPPEFIEATLTESNGVVHGKYRSRYQIVDRAISPDVNFEFSGSPSGGAINCIWSGAGGAKGQLTVRMTGENDLRVDWSATEIGSVQGLASGTAVLTRRIE